MKANELPEKVYIHKSQYWGLMANEYTKNGIEYTRTDAFIEKACDAYCRLCDRKDCGNTDECLWAEKFRKHLMK